MKRLLILGLIVLTIAAANSCRNNKYDKLYPAPAGQVTTCDTTDTVSYSKDIVPILQTNCYSPGNGCHDVTGSAVSGYNYTTYTDISNNALNGSLLPDINWESGHNQMPKDAAKLSECDINKFTKWVNEGAPNN